MFGIKKWKYTAKQARFLKQSKKKTITFRNKKKTTTTTTIH